MPDPQLYQNDTGTVIRRAIVDRATGEPVNLAGASALIYRVEHPDSTAVEWPAATSPGDPTSMDHTLVAGDLPQAGTMRLQPIVTLSPTVDLAGEIETLDVGARLKPPAA